jgi:DNA-binding NtrC family response regulator
MMATPAILAGRRVLIVEDESLVGILIEEFLYDFGCVPLGPYGNVAEALEAIRSQAFDVAILDIDLNGERSYPIADALAERGVPFLFLSGYGDVGVPVEYADRKVCAKPFTGDGLATLLAAALTSGGVAH